MNVWSISDIGAVRQQNQDAFQVETFSPESGLYVVCDGMGGARAGNVASQVAAETFCDALKERFADPEQTGEIGDLLQQSVIMANRVVWHRGNIDPGCLGMGTTLVGAFIIDGTVHVVNVGDSRAYMINAEGIRRITQDHSVVEEMVQRGEITPEQARVHPQKNLITRALGAMEAVKSDVFEEPCVEGNYLLLCTDGLTNVMTDQEILYEVIHGGAVEDCCKRMLDTVLSRGAPDNVTIVLVQL